MDRCFVRSLVVNATWADANSDAKALVAVEFRMRYSNTFADARAAYFFAFEDGTAKCFFIGNFIVFGR